MYVPEQVDYRRMAVLRQTLVGTVPVASMRRLAAAAQRVTSADARLRLEFAEDDQRRVRVAGQVVASVVLQCQRCSTSFEHVLDAVIAGVIVADDAAAANVPHADEPILAAADTLAVHVLAEDELLLALPMVAHCSNADCQTRYNASPLTKQADSAAPGQRTNNPFAALEQLRHDHDSD